MGAVRKKKAHMSQEKVSLYQAAIYEAIERLTGDLMVQAVFGAGKTTTLVGMAKRLPAGKTAIFMAFNSSIAQELGARLPQGVPAKTFNAYGNQTCKKAGIWGNPVDGKYKYRDVIRNLSRVIFPNITDEERLELEDASSEHARMARLNLTGCSGLAELESITQAHNNWRQAKSSDAKLVEDYSQALIQQGDDYDLPILSGTQHHRMCRLVCNALLDGVRMAQGKKGPRSMDFTDQVWLPVLLRLPAEQFDFVMVDECQDLKRVELNLISKARKPGTGRMVFVGDRHQAIYRFAGADSGSVDRILAVTKATELPLSVSYRCPTSHVALANSIWPGAEAAPGAKAGILERGIDVDSACAQAIPSTDPKKYEDLFLCRNNAPLLKVAYKLIRAGKPAKVRGKGLDEGLKALAKRLGAWGRKNNFSFAEFGKLLDAYGQEKAREAKETLREEKADAAIDALNDKLETLRVIWSVSRPDTLAGLDAAIKAIFADKAEGGVIWLSTVHKAKGLEAKRVYIIDPQLMPSKYAKSAAAVEQENNLLYVAVTRAIDALYFLKPLEEDAAEEVAA